MPRSVITTLLLPASIDTTSAPAPRVRVLVPVASSDTVIVSTPLPASTTAPEPLIRISVAVSVSFLETKVPPVTVAADTEAFAVTEPLLIVSSAAAASSTAVPSDTFTVAASIVAPTAEELTIPSVTDT